VHGREANKSPYLKFPLLFIAFLSYRVYTTFFNGGNMSSGHADTQSLVRELADLRGQLEQARRTIADLNARSHGPARTQSPDVSLPASIPYARIGELIRTLAAGGEPKDWFGELIVQLREWSGCEAVGIRLKQGFDYPYFETRGFPVEFVALESQLCAKSATGEPILDAGGEPILECMCGNVIMGRYDPSLAFFTVRGSFWTNNTTVLLAETMPAQRLSVTRNRCNGMGYQSVALVPLRFAGTTYGLLQFNDQRPDRFTPELLTFLELVADSAALALSRLEAHRDLAASEAKYRALFDSAGDAVFIVDEALHFISVNKLACERLGYTEAELLTMGPADIDAPELRHRRSELVLELERKSELLFESVHMTKDGRRIPVEINARPVAFRGKPAHMSIARDVSERKRAESALRESEEKLRTIADFTYDWEYWRGPDGRLLWVSPSCERITGYTSAEFAADPALLAKIVHPGDAALFREHERFVEAGGGGLISLEFRIISKSGGTVWINHSCEAISRPDGTALGRRVSNRDVTDRKRLEAARAEDLTRIKEQRDFLESLIANAPVTVGVVEGPSHRYVLANPAYEAVVSPQLRPLIGHTLAEVFPEVASEMSGLFDLVYATGRPVRLREFAVPAAGRLTWWNAEYLPLFDADGGVPRILIIGHEITEVIAACKQAEEESLKSRAVIDSLVEGLIVAGADGAILSVNPAARRIFGLGEDITPPAHCKEFLNLYAMQTPDGRALPRRQRPLARALRGESFSGYELRVSRISGGLSLILSFSGAPVKDQNGNVLFSFTCFEDVTDRRLADAELKRQTVLLTSLIDSTPDLIFIKDPKGVYLGCNPAFCEFLGKSQKEIVGRTDRELFDPGIAQALQKRDQAMLEGGKPRRDDQWITFPSGNKMFLDSLTAPIFDSEGGLVGVLGMDRDITPRHRLEQDLRAAVRTAEKANAAKTMFLANMSHEIRTPLNGLMGMMQLLRSTELSAEQREFADMAIRSGSRLTKLLSDILDLSRIESDRLTINETTFRLTNVFSSLADTFAPLSMEKGIFIQTSVADDVPDLVIGDEVRIRQVIFNLVGNAMKFSSLGEISVSVSRLAEVSARRARLLFVVSDSGAGIPDDKIGAVCEAFTQVDDSFTRHQQGAGLGLTITKRLVALMGGTMAIDSELGRGTSVYVMLPLGLSDDGQSAGQSAAFPAAEGKGTYRILFAEDDPLSQFSVKRFLEKAGHAVHCAGDGEAVLAALRQERFDCVLMDVQMPVMDGAEATRRIRADVSGDFHPGVPIIAVTAYAMSGDMEKFLAVGMDAYVAKPLELDALETLIDKIVAAKRPA
jgi:PAS domain S-box-containing protein